MGMKKFINELKRRRYRKIKGLHHSIAFGFPIYIGGNVSVGKRTSISRYCHILSGKNSSIRIGEDCKLAYNVHVRSITHDVNDLRHMIEADIEIGDRVWLCNNVYVREGIIIEDDSVIGANSIVTEDVKAGSVVGGVPARLIRFKEGFTSAGM